MKNSVCYLPPHDHAMLSFLPEMCAVTDTTVSDYIHSTVLPLRPLLQPEELRHAKAMYKEMPCIKLQHYTADLNPKSDILYKQAFASLEASSSGNGNAGAFENIAINALFRVMQKISHETAVSTCRCLKVQYTMLPQASPSLLFKMPVFSNWKHLLHSRFKVIKRFNGWKNSLRGRNLQLGSALFTALIWDWGQETDPSELFYALQWNASIVIDALFINVIDFKELRASQMKPLTASKAIIAILKTAETELML